MATTPDIRSGLSWSLGVCWTTHALQRWDERTPADSVAPETAWGEGRTLPRLLWLEYINDRRKLPEAVRVYFGDDAAESWGAVMILNDSKITTVLRPCHEADWIEAALRAHWRRFAGGSA